MKNYLVVFTDARGEIRYATVKARNKVGAAFMIGSLYPHNGTSVKYVTVERLED